MAAGDLRNAGEVVGRWGGVHGPFQGVRLPGIGRGESAETEVQQKIQNDHRYAHRHDKAADGGEQVEPVPAEAGFIGVHAPRHAKQAGEMHQQKGRVKADKRQPEAPFA